MIKDQNQEKDQSLLGREVNHDSVAIVERGHQREKYLGISVTELPGKFSSSGKFCGNWQKMAAKGCHLKKSIWKI